MIRNDKNNDSALVDSIALADSTFLCCRLGSGEFLDLLVDVFSQVHECGTLFVEMPADWLASAKFPFGEIRVHKAPTNRGLVADLTPDKQFLFWFIVVAAEELQRLSAVGPIGAVASLGYAVHPLCNLVQSDETFESKLFLFNFRIAAFHWSALSEDMREALCNLVGFERAEADQLVARENFTINMYPNM